MLSLVTYLSARFSRDEGATMVEYGLMVALVAIVVAVGAAVLGVGIDALFDDAAAQVNPAP